MIGVPASSWQNPALSPARRAEAIVAEMTLEEKIGLLHSQVAVPMVGTDIPEGALGSAAFVPGIPRLGIPSIQETDASLGVTNPGGVRPVHDVTALPASLLLGATFDASLAEVSGAAVGAEAAAQGFHVLLAGGANLIREPRNGRNFEYISEDPLLTGALAGGSIAGVQGQGVVSTVKHLVLNAQETGRVVLSANISEAALRESDLLAFQIAIETGAPGSVMTSYNRVNGTHASEHPFLLTTVLKGDWAYPGFVMSDWGSTHSTVEAVLAGLDRQSGEQLDPEVLFGAPLLAAVEDGRVPVKRIDDMAGRILAAHIAAGQLDPGAAPPVVDLAAHADLAQQVAEQGIVLLANDGLLPIDPGVGRITLIGGHADQGVLSGSGSSQVTPPGSVIEASIDAPQNPHVYHPSAPLLALRAVLPDSTVEFESGGDPERAAALARESDIAIVFAEQWAREAADAPDLALPGNQDRLIAAVAAANPRTVVVLESGGPVLMPWLSDVAAVLAAWYPGARGGEALAALLTGRVAPSGRLPVTFPASTDQLPRPVMPDPASTTSEPGVPPKGALDIDYDIEGSDVGYRWYLRTGQQPLFPFGYGLSYTTFAYANLDARSEGGRLRLEVDVTNTGGRAGIDTPQFYVERATGGFRPRLAGWHRLRLKAGQTRRANATVDPRLIATFNTERQRWRIAAGTYRVSVGASAADHALGVDITIPASDIPA
jgi:beta-glucosidase